MEFGREAIGFPERDKVVKLLRFPRDSGNVVRELFCISRTCSEVILNNSSGRAVMVLSVTYK